MVIPERFIREKRTKTIIGAVMIALIITGCFFTAQASEKESALEAPAVRGLLQDRTKGFSVRPSKVEGADRYELSWSLDPDFKTETIIASDAGKRTVHVKGFKPGDIVYVRFRAERGEGENAVASDWGRSRSIVITDRIVRDKNPTPYYCAIYSIDDDGICVYWKKPEYADGYQIWRSYHKNYGFEPVGEIEGHNNFTWYDTDFDEDASKIYYRVCAWHDEEDGKRIYTRFGNLMRAVKRENLKLDRPEIFIFSGEERQLHALYEWGNAHPTVWSSSDPETVSVDEYGKITANRKGAAMITCRIPDTDQERSMAVTVDREDDPLLKDYTLRYRKGEDGIWYNPDAEKTDEAVIMMAGDLTCLAPQMDAANTPDHGYDFFSNYEYVGQVLKKSDLAIGNLETMIASEFSYANEEPYIDKKPVANTSSRYLEAVIDGGFDVASNGNNHNCDTGKKGIFSTIETLDRFGIPHTGMFTSADEDRYLILDVNGIKVGLAAYNYKFPGYNGKDADWTQEERDTLLAYYDPETAKSTIREMREAGAEFVIIYMHWGTKNYFTVKSVQERMARELAEAGADYIAGAHSHTIQPYEEIVTEDGRTVPCIYSMGDFNSHIHQIQGNRDSVLMCIKLHRNENGEVELCHSGYIPFYIYTSYGKKPYVTMPMDPDWNGGLDDLYKQDKIRSRIAEEVGEDAELFKPWMMTDTTPFRDGSEDETEDLPSEDAGSESITE